MKHYIKAGLLTAAILFPLFWYVYQKGMEDGVARYKRSAQFQLTLDSMFNFGLQECREEKTHVAHQHN